MRPRLRATRRGPPLLPVSGLESALQARFRRVLRHRGPKKAVVAVAHALLRAAYHVLADHAVCRELGVDYYDRQHGQRVTHRAIQLLERQGYRVTLEPRRISADDGLTGFSEQ